MSDRVHVYADESGCFAFARKNNVSRYFILCTVSMTDLSIMADLLDLRRSLLDDGMALGPYFHASADKQAVRDEVFRVIGGRDFSIQATILEKSKAHPNLRRSRADFYKFGWYHHFRYGIAPRAPLDASLLVTVATIGIKKEQRAFQVAVGDVMADLRPNGGHTTTFCPAAAEPGIQIADYCAWAIQRRYERSDDRSYDLIRDRLAYEHAVWRDSVDHYY